MHYAEDLAPNAQAITALFTITFTTSEGETEGTLIGAMVDQMLRDRQDDGTRVFTATDNGTLVGAVLFSPLRYAGDPRTVVLLSPMAVATTRHGEGIGQALITHALNVLRNTGADIAITYGSPVFYGKTGFSPIGEDMATPPLPLSFPHGWIAQSLTTEPLTPLQGKPTCVPALNNPDVW
ncbi:GNAT family N-acetyltransferase [Shimia sagamensis]|uniref:Predicted N-acetyltransferase YhbS n=1 Tax=Shimia sagamensis TaxID=1566352 RepID=A0ABY1P075_9RHOB|nr:N-acetyltransferase [Shimia sagamensis]SMP21869.1 Predicted N-acetyltransferase YhbS [Shimia sagamensis]